MNPLPLRSLAFASLLVAACSFAPQGPDDDQTTLGDPISRGSFKVRIAAGRTSDYTDPSGAVWSHDVDFDVGAVASNADVITGTQSPGLFRGERWASRTASPRGFTYTIPNVPAGAYSVTLSFAETSGGGVQAARERQFDVLIDEKKVLSDFDIFAEAGLDRAVFKRFTVDSAGGNLTLRFAPGAAQNPKVNAIAIDPLTPGARATGHPITRSFFGLHLQKWPAAVTFGSQRLWDSQTAWSQIETAPGVFGFDTLKKRIAAAAAANVDVIYTFGRTPHWLSSDASNVTCAGGVAGECAPPSDVDRGDSSLKAFWTAFMDSICTDVDGAGRRKVAPHKTCGPLKFFELWNEPNAAGYWTGTPTQLARMSADAATIIKRECESCLVLTAPVSCGGQGTRSHGQSGHCDDWAASYLTAWEAFGHLPDIGTWHPYPARTNVVPAPFPETNVSASPLCAASLVPNASCDRSVVEQMQQMRSVFDAHGLKDKPMFGSEGSWGSDHAQPDTEAQAAYLARWFLLQAGAGVSRTYWYAQDNTLWGTLRGAEQNNPPHDKDNAVNASGIAYREVYGWLVGASIEACAASGTVWSCAITKGDGQQALAIWDIAQTCTAIGTDGTKHHCTTSRHAVGAAYTHWHDLAGNSGAIDAHVADIGARPVLLD